MAGWRVIGAFWGCLVVAGAAGAGVLQWLGPPVRAVPVAVVRTVEAPEPGPAPLPRVAGPDAALLERSAAFPTAFLPRVAADGRAARTVYAAPAVAVPAGAVRVALLVSGVGLSERDTAAAIEALPGPVSFAVSAYAGLSPATLAAMRAAGHELFASIPMEPKDFPLSDEGPRSLLSGAEPAANRANLEWALGRVEGAVGATGASDGLRGERFAEQAGVMDPVLDEVARRGLLYVDPRPGQVVGHAAARPGLHVRGVDAVVDDPPARAEIEAKLAGLERTAREKGAALGLAGRLQPVTVDRIAAWTKTLAGRGFVLVPVSALVPSPTVAR